jgi:hypothetical protein
MNKVSSVYALKNHEESLSPTIKWFAKWWLYLMVGSYFYCLPLARIHHVEATDFRLYDLMLFIGLLVFILPFYSYILETIRINKWISAYFLFTIWCLVSITVTMAMGGTDIAFVALARLSRFVAYGLVAAAIMTFISDEKELRRLCSFFFILIAISAFLSTLQSFGLVKQLWPQYWLYYGNLPVGTLSPHHLHPGTVAVMGFALAIGYLLYLKSFSRLLISFSLAVMVYATFILVSRSGWLGLIIVLGSTVFFMLRKIEIVKIGFLIFWVALGGASLIYMGGEKIVDNVQTDWQRGFEGRYKSGGAENLSQTRIALYLDLPNVIIENPWILITGTGIGNSIRVLRKGAAMHNNYFQVLIETGVLGLYFYVSILILIWRQISIVASNVKSQFGKAFIFAFRNFFLALLFLNLFNETFYLQYSTFSLTGQIMAFAALSLHPVWLGDRKSPSENSSDKKLMSLRKPQLAKLRTKKINTDNKLEL